MKLLLLRIPPDANRRVQHTAAYFALSALLCEVCGTPHVRLLRTESGKPFLPDGPAVSLSHCAGLIACAVGDNAPIGVDAEPIRPPRPRVAQRSFSSAEQAALAADSAPALCFTRLWTLKESLVKATGVGISAPLHTLEFALTADEIVPPACGFGFTQLLTPDGFVVSLCGAGEENRLRRLPDAPAMALVETGGI